MLRAPLTAWRRARYTFAASLLLALLLLAPTAVLAVPASPRVMTLQQPDGTSFAARLWGDERMHGWQTVDGYTIVLDRTSGFWHFAQTGTSGDLEPSGLRPGIDAAPAETKRGLRPTPESPSGQRARRFGARAGAVPGGRPDAMVPAQEPGPERAVPPTGTGKMPVMLVTFSDRNSTKSKASFQTLLFGTGVNSMADYYKQVSYNAFTVSAGPAGIGGWYRASHGHDYYGQDWAGPGDDYWPGDLVWEAANAANTAGFNFAPYDQDGDCEVDNLVVVHQGTGQEAGGPSTDIWSHSWNLSSAYYYYYSNYPPLTTNSVCTANPAQHVVVDKYTVQPEILWGSTQITIGVFAHEFGHALGLPDLYDTDGSSEGVGEWTLMAGGSWNGPVGGDRPAHMDPWSKWRLGWITPPAVCCSPSVSLPAVETSKTGVYRVLNGSVGSSGEYFLIENRQKTGFDVGLPGAGLLAWHIDEAKSNNQKECWPSGTLCSAATHYKVALVQADNLWHLEAGSNRGDAGDPYPGTYVKRTLNGSSSPNSNIFAGTAGTGGVASGVFVTSISNSASTMTATLGSATTQPLWVTKAGLGAGTVTSSPAGISCSSGTCSASFACNSGVTLTATPIGGAVFTGWSGACSGTGSCTVTMSEARSVTATFLLPPAEVSVTKTDGTDTVSPGDPLVYTIVVSNEGPNTANGVTVVDTIPASLVSPTWTCTPAGGAACLAASGSGHINYEIVNLPSGGSVTYSVSGTVSAAPASLSNTVTATVEPSANSDPDTTNNTATDTDRIVCAGDRVTMADGRVATLSVGAGATQWISFAVRPGSSYSLEVTPALGGAVPGVTVFGGADGCSGTVTATTNDTTSFEPVSGGVRQAFTAGASELSYRARIVNGSGGALTYHVSAAETSAFSPAWSTNGSYNTYYSLRNTTKQMVRAKLLLTTVSGGAGAEMTFEIPAGATISTNTVALAVARNATGTVLMTHDGPPGALVVEAAIANFGTTPAYIQPVRFQNVRENR